MSQNLKSLFKGAVADGVLGKAVAQTFAVPDLGVQIHAGLGISVDDVTSSEVLLVTLLVDDSGSIRSGNNEVNVRAGCNLVFDALSASKQSGDVLVSVRYLNGTILMPYVPLDQAIRLDSSNFHASGVTPLYDQSIITLGQVIAKAQEFQNAGVACRSVTGIITDGAEYGSTHYRKPEDVGKVVKDMSESHIVCAMGIDDGQTDYRDIFSRMGVDDRWILTPGNTPSEIRRAFQVFSQSAVRASQGAQNFSKAASAGFTG